MGYLVKLTFTLMIDYLEVEQRGWKEMRRGRGWLHQKDEGLGEGRRAACGQNCCSVPPCDECVWWCNTSESGGTFKCHWTFPICSSLDMLPEHYFSLSPFRKHDVKKEKNRELNLPDPVCWWNQRKHIMFKWWVHGRDTALSQRIYSIISVLEWLPVLQQFTHIMKCHSSQKLLWHPTVWIDQFPKQFLLRMSSYRKSVSFRRSGRSPSSVEGQRHSQRTEKEVRQIIRQALLLGWCCHVTGGQMRTHIQQKTGLKTCMWASWTQDVIWFWSSFYFFQKFDFTLSACVCRRHQKLALDNAFFTYLSIEEFTCWPCSSNVWIFQSIPLKVCFSKWFFLRLWDTNLHFSSTYTHQPVCLLSILWRFLHVFQCMIYTTSDS